MNELKDIIAKNLTELRKQHNLTQSELAEKLNYSDKAISKWERGESLPDVEVLYALAAKYGVTLDYLTQEVHEDVGLTKEIPRINGNRLIITLLAISVVWFLATSVYVYTKMFLDIYFWMAFIWALPVSCVLAIIFNSIWGKRIFNFYLVSALVWTLLVAIYLQLIHLNLWAIFFLGLPGQAAIILWSRLK